MRHGKKTSIAVACLSLLLCACHAIQSRREVAASRALGAIASARPIDRAPDSGLRSEPLLLAESRPDSIAPEPAADPLRAIQVYHTMAIAHARQKAVAVTITQPATGAVVQSEAIAEFTKKCNDRAKRSAADPQSPPLSPELTVCPVTRVAGPSSRT